MSEDAVVDYGMEDDEEVVVSSTISKPKGRGKENSRSDRTRVSRDKVGASGGSGPARCKCIYDIYDIYDIHMCLSQMSSSVTLLFNVPDLVCRRNLPCLPIISTMIGMCVPF